MRRQVPNLRRLFRGGEILANPYHTLYLAQPTPGTAIARKFGEFLVSERGQALMRDFGKVSYGESMYNDAESTARMIRD